MKHRQRVAIALKPALVRADEIVFWLDAPSQTQILNLLETLAKDLGLTLAFIKYNLGVIRRICGRVLVMQSGKIVEFPATTQFFDTC